MSVDISKIKVGDKLLIEVEFVQQINYNILRVIDNSGEFSISAKSVLQHTPAPRQVKVGDTVRSHVGELKYKVIAIHDQDAWLCGENNRPWTASIEALTLE